MQESRDVGHQAVGLRWVDVKKGDGTQRSRLCGSRGDGGMRAPPPPIEIAKSLGGDHAGRGGYQVQSYGRWVQLIGLRSVGCPVCRKRCIAVDVQTMPGVTMRISLGLAST